MASKDDELEMHDEEFDESAEMMDGDEEDASSEEESSAKNAMADHEEAVSSAAARKKLRESMAAEVEAFLARGGQIQEVEANVMGDPPRKPQTNYGSRPI